MAAAVLELFPETKLGHGPATESGFFYDFYREKPFTPEDLEAIEKKMQELVKQDLPYAREFLPRARGTGALQVGRRLHEVPLHRAVHRARREDLHLQDRQVHRLLPRAAHPVHRAHQGVQAAQHRGRVLAGRREESAAAAHLRHVVLLQEGPRRVSAQDRGSEEARPSRAGQAARPVLHPGAGRAGADLLASQGRHHAQGDGRLDARRVPEARLLAGVHAARRARRPVEDQRPRRLLRAEHVHPDGTGRRRLSHEADELSVPHPDLSRQR